MNKEFDIGKCFSDGWNIYKANMGLLILSYLVVGIVSFFTIGILAGPLIVGLVLMITRLIKKDPAVPTVGDIFKGMDKFGAAFVCILLFVVMAMIAGVIPIIGQLAMLVISPLLMYSLMYVAFEDLGAVDACKKTIQGLISGKMLMPILLGVLAGIVGGLGGLLCGVGVIFTIPYAAVLYVCAYHQMTDSDDITDAEVLDDDDFTPPTSPNDSATKINLSKEVASVDVDDPPTVD